MIFSRQCTKAGDGYAWLALPFLVVGIFLTSFWLHMISGAGRSGEAVVLVFPPHWNRPQTLAATVGLHVPIVDFGRWPFVLAIAPNGIATVAQAYEAGALLVLKSPALALCGKPT